MLKAGVIDPAGYPAALQNAASIAALMLTTEALIADFKGEEKAAAIGGAKAGHGRDVLGLKCLGKIHVGYNSFQTHSGQARRLIGKTERH